ncbi:MAG: hypothetical protein Q8P67_06970, partial [archaeon]|nr:hypothetical protein [archaeon]
MSSSKARGSSSNERGRQEEWEGPKEVQFDDKERPRFLSTLVEAGGSGTRRRALGRGVAGAAAERIRAQREALPVHLARSGFLEEFAEHGALVLVGETGCGKTTQIPQYVYEAGAHKYRQGGGGSKG